MAISTDRSRSSSTPASVRLFVRLLSPSVGRSANCRFNPSTIDLPPQNLTMIHLNFFRRGHVEINVASSLEMRPWPVLIQLLYNTRRRPAGPFLSVNWFMRGCMYWMQGWALSLYTQRLVNNWEPAETVMLLKSLRWVLKLIDHACPSVPCCVILRPMLEYNLLNFSRCDFATKYPNYFIAA